MAHPPVPPSSGLTEHSLLKQSLRSRKGCWCGVRHCELLIAGTRKVSGRFGMARVQHARVYLLLYLQPELQNHSCPESLHTAAHSKGRNLGVVLVRFVWLEQCSAQAQSGQPTTERGALQLFSAGRHISTPAMSTKEPGC